MTDSRKYDSLWELWLQDGTDSTFWEFAEKREQQLQQAKLSEEAMKNIRYVVTPQATINGYLQQGMLTQQEVQELQLKGLQNAYRQTRASLLPGLGGALGGLFGDGYGS